MSRKLERGQQKSQGPESGSRKHKGEAASQAAGGELFSPRSGFAESLPE